jgi:hypothetical protein
LAVNENCGESGQFDNPWERVQRAKASATVCVVVEAVVGRGEPTAAAGGEQRDHGNRDDGGGDESTGTTHEVWFLSVESGERHVDSEALPFRAV